MLAVAANMADEDDIKRMVAAHDERFGRLDVLMNNAGLGIGGAIADAETKKLDMQIAVNLRAVYLVTREAIPMLKEAGADGGALIVNTASIAGKRPQGWLAAYSATKAAVIALTEATAKELAGDGVRCTAICPGFVDTRDDGVDPGRGPAVRDDPARGRGRGGALPAAALAGCIVPEVMMVPPAGRWRATLAGAASEPADRERSSDARGRRLALAARGRSGASLGRSAPRRRRRGSRPSAGTGPATRRGRGGVAAAPARGVPVRSVSARSSSSAQMLASSWAVSVRSSRSVALRARRPAPVNRSQARAKVRKSVRPPQRWAASIGHTPPVRSV